MLAKSIGSHYDLRVLRDRRVITFDAVTASLLWLINRTLYDR
ncbi:MAG: hypothetical protein RIG63_25710 [Coleofasciculus chthonoplastes F3-SA18-01]|jgi:hypothetical protein